LTKYRRTIRRSHEDNKKLPVIFNDYMNCLMGDPSAEKEIPLIDAAAKVGCEYYVIDAGWYADGEWWNSVLIYDYGIGYIKMDYNINAGIGTEFSADSFGDGLLSHNRAYLAWLEGILDKYPGLVIENKLRLSQGQFLPVYAGCQFINPECKLSQRKFCQTI